MGFNHGIWRIIYEWGLSMAFNNWIYIYMWLSIMGYKGKYINLYLPNRIIKCIWTYINHFYGHWRRYNDICVCWGPEMQVLLMLNWALAAKPPLINRGWRYIVRYISYIHGTICDGKSCWASSIKRRHRILNGSQLRIGIKRVNIG